MSTGRDELLWAVVNYDTEHPDYEELSDIGDGQHLCSVAADLIHELRKDRDAAQAEARVYQSLYLGLVRAFDTHAQQWMRDDGDGGLAGTLARMTDELARELEQMVDVACSQAHPAEPAQRGDVQ